MIKWIAIITAIICFQTVDAANWYVDNQANGANTGASWQDAFQGIADIPCHWYSGSWVWNDIKAGDTINFSGGTAGRQYDSLLEIRASGKPDSAIVIRPGRDSGHNGVVTLKQGVNIAYFKNHIILDGNVNGQRHMIVKNPTNVGISVYLSDNVAVRFVEVTECGNSSDNHGIGIRSSHQITVTSCHIHDIYQDGINFNSGGTDFGDCIIESTTIENVGDDGIQTGSGLIARYCVIDGRTQRTITGHPDGIQTGVGSRYHRIYNNILKNFGQCLFIEKTKGFVEIYNNILCQDPDYDSGTGRGVSLHPDIGARIDGHVLFANNVIYNFNSYFGAMIGFSDFAFNEADTVLVVNNIFMNNLHHYSGQEIHVGPDNLFFKSTDARCWDSSGPPSQRICDGTAFGSGTFIDPLLSDAAGYDFTLEEESPARNSGVNLSEYFTTDFDGNERPAEGTWDIGAYQYTVSAVSDAMRDGTLRQAFTESAIYYTVAGQRIGRRNALPNGVYLVVDPVDGRVRKQAVVR